MEVKNHSKQPPIIRIEAETYTHSEVLSRYRHHDFRAMISASRGSKVKMAGSRPRDILFAMATGESLIKIDFF